MDFTFRQHWFDKIFNDPELEEAQRGLICLYLLYYGIQGQRLQMINWTPHMKEIFSSIQEEIDLNSKWDKYKKYVDL